MTHANMIEPFLQALIIKRHSTRKATFISTVIKQYVRYQQIHYHASIGVKVLSIYILRVLVVA